MSNRTRVGWYEGLAFLAGCVLFALAAANRLTFPFPWNDEARFYLPALWFAKHNSLNPVIVNAPRGIYWVPDGFTVILGVVLRLFGETIEVARTACECAVAAGIVVFALAFRELSGSRTAGALATLWLLTPPVVFAANMVRMEAPLFLLIALALRLHLKGYYLGACAVLFGSLLLHPALGLAAVAYAILFSVFGWKKAHSRPRFALEFAVLTILLLCFLLEGFRVSQHFGLFEAHMAYQLSKKLGRPLLVRLIKPQGVILFFCGVLSLLNILLRKSWKGRSSKLDILALTVAALGVQTYAVLGAELQYDVYSLSVSPAIIFCLVAGTQLAAPREPTPDPPSSPKAS